MSKKMKVKRRNPIAREMRTTFAGLYRQQIVPNKKKVAKKFSMRDVDLKD